MSFNNKITDLKFHVDNLIAKDICKYFINVYENNSKYADTESSYLIANSHNVRI